MNRQIILPGLMHLLLLKVILSKFDLFSVAWAAESVWNISADHRFIAFSVDSCGYILGCSVFGADLSSSLGLRE